jgi:hypothetical protein
MLLLYILFHLQSTQLGFTTFWCIMPIDVTTSERGRAAWKRKIQELADRGIQLGQLLEFYDLLGRGSVMPGFHPLRSTTNDVVRQAIIPLSAPRQMSGHGQAYASKLGHHGQPASRMVTHNWNNIFSHLVASVLADAFDVPSYAPFLLHLGERLPALRDELRRRGQMEVSYWICAFTVNQHASICGGFGPAPKGQEFLEWDRKRYDSVTGELYPLCRCATPKFFNADCDLTELNKFDPLMETVQQIWAFSFFLHLCSHAKPLYNPICGALDELTATWLGCHKWKICL